MTTTLLTGATVWAGPDCVPRPAWLLVAHGRIAAVGAHDEPPPAADVVVDRPGAHILPGFVDSHAHPTAAAWLANGVDGAGWPNLDTALSAIRSAALADHESPWLLVWNARPFAWPERRLPSAGELEAVAPGRRVLVSGLDVHRGSLSPAAMQAMGLGGRLASSDDVTRDRRGRATGEVWEQVYGEALARALADNEESLDSYTPDDLVRRELDRCLSLGLTHVHEAYVPPQHHERMRSLAGAGAPRLSWAVGAPEGLLTPVREPTIAPGGDYGAAGREAKLFLDGGDRCALRLPTRALGRLALCALRESARAHHLGPLRDALRRRTEIHSGRLELAYLRYDADTLAGLLDGYLEAGVRPRLHALGNLAVRQAAQVLRSIGAPSRGAVIDHLVLTDPAAIDLVADCGAWATYQPGFLTTFGPQIVAGGTGHYLDVLAGRRLLDAGVPLTLASDHPAGPLDPLGNLRLAVTRTLPDGRTIQPAQALTPSEALRALTTAAASSLGAVGAGGIAAGEVADLAICDGNPFDRDSQVVQTWVGGRTAWTGPTSVVSPYPPSPALDDRSYSAGRRWARR